MARVFPLTGGTLAGKQQLRNLFEDVMGRSHLPSRTVFNAVLCGVTLGTVLTIQGCALVDNSGQAAPTPTSPIPQPSLAQPSVQPVVSSAQSTISAATLNFLRQRSRNITVKVWADQTWGSGVIIQRQQGKYLVLTNAHVVQSGKQHQVQTSDGKQHRATLVAKPDFQGRDLALMQFESNSPYPVASLGQAINLKPGSLVFAAGFPLKPEGAAADGFMFMTGQVALVNTKPFTGGYQLGYSNPIVKGMSGGPVLNSQGVVVAVNGMQAFPLWGDPYVFEDGTTPPKSQQDLLTRSSWGIPIETFLSLVPKSLLLSFQRS